MGFLSALAACLLDPSRENRKRLKGAKGEAQGVSGLLLFLPSGYRVISDVLLPTPYGTTQVDHIVVSNHGIFVIESKNVSGDVYGSPNDKYWTVCRGTAKFKFFNPLRQNASHIRALAAITGLPEAVFHSLVFFWADDCRFGSPMPENVLQLGLCSCIRRQRAYLLPDRDLEVALEMIAATRLRSTRANIDAHVARLRQWNP